MALNVEQILALYWARKRAMDPRLGKLLELQTAYQGDMSVPLPEMGQAEKPLVANLIASGLDQYAMRIASVMPDVYCPPTREGEFKEHTRHAQDRRDAIKGWWSMNSMHLLMRKRARYLIGYATAPVVIRPRAPKARRAKRDIPYWQLRDPLTALPPPGEEIDPADAIFTFKRTYRWLRDNYPDQAQRIERPADCGPDHGFEMVEYMDDETMALICLGASPDRYSPTGENPHAYSAAGTSRYNTRGSSPFEIIEFDINRAGICPAVVPGRICLGERQGQFDGLLGLYWWQSKLMALGGIAAERDIFPEEWAVSRPNETVEVIVAADGPQGVIGEIAGGDIKSTHSPPGQATMLMIDRTERAMRVGGAVPAEFGGESPTNIRTARRGSEVLSSAVDFPIQEAQEVLAAALQEENVRAIAIAKAHYSGTNSFYFSWNGRGARASYDMAATFDSDENIVTYSMPGSDVNNLIIGVGQRVGMETMSKYRGMQLDPLIDDPEREHGRIIVEGLERALLQGMQTLASQPGGIPPSDLARIITLVSGERPKSLAEAVDQVQKEAQRRQAAQGPPGSPEGPVPPGSPEAQPGIALPGQGAEAGQAIEGATPSQQGLSQLLTSLRRPTMAVPAETGAAPR
jgi:hypothetical protein